MIRRWLQRRRIYAHTYTRTHMQMCTRCHTVHKVNWAQLKARCTMLQVLHDARLRRALTWSQITTHTQTQVLVCISAARSRTPRVHDWRIATVPNVAADTDDDTEDARNPPAHLIIFERAPVSRSRFLCAPILVAAILICPPNSRD